MSTIMELNKETANRLWVKQFGKRQKAFDFAGREIAKAAYNDRKSDFGWNVDHILPESKGGKTADHNLICCNIKTNDEKADRFPAFKANGNLFEIQRRENHYEIIPKSLNTNDTQPEQKSINFYDVAQGLKCWKKSKPINNEFFLAYANIYLKVSNGSDSTINQFCKFIGELFESDNIYVKKNAAYITYPSSTYITFTILNFDVPYKEDSEEWLNRCILLNTYREYLIVKTEIRELTIKCGLCCYETEVEMRSRINDDIINNQYPAFTDSLVINELIKNNTSAIKAITEKDVCSSITSWQHINQKPDKWYKYNIVFSKLSKNIQKHLNK